MLDWKCVAAWKFRWLQLWHLEERGNPKVAGDGASRHKTRRKRLYGRAAELYRFYDSRHLPGTVSSSIVDRAPNRRDDMKASMDIRLCNTGRGFDHIF